MHIGQKNEKMAKKVKLHAIQKCKEDKKSMKAKNRNSAKKAKLQIRQKR